MSTAVSIPIYQESNVPLSISGSTPFGYYDTDAQFQIDGPRFMLWAAYRLGYPIMEVELQEKNFYAAFEDAITVYSKEIYDHKIKDNFLSMEGATTGSNLNNTLIQPSLANLIRLAKDYGSEAGSGGNINYYTGSIQMTVGNQFYDLDLWARENNIITGSDGIEIKRIFYEAPPAIVRYFDPYAGTGTGLQSLMDSFGFGNMSPGITFMMMPVYYDVLKIQAIEFNDQVRRSGYSFELVNNKLRIFPIPTFDRPLYFQYIINSERSALSRNGDPKNLITNVSNVPYTFITYAYINGPGKKWIFDYALAICKETLGNIRSKYQSNPIPGNEVTLNGNSLVEQAKNEQDKLIEKLRTNLEESGRRAQLQKQADEAESMKSTLTNVPMTIFIG